MPPARAEWVGGTSRFIPRRKRATQIIICVRCERSRYEVLLVDDHPLFLDGLKNLLTSRGVQVVGGARDGWRHWTRRARCTPK